MSQSDRNGVEHESMKEHLQTGTGALLVGEAVVLDGDGYLRAVEGSGLLVDLRASV